MEELWGRAKGQVDETGAEVWIKPHAGLLGVGGRAERQATDCLNSQGPVTRVAAGGLLEVGFLRVLWVCGCVQ